MRLRSTPFYLSLALLSTSLWAAPPTDMFTLSTPTKVPGTTLQPGSYSIRILNRLSDRDIVRVDSTSGDIHATFIGIPNSRIGKPAASNIVNWSNGAEGAAYLRGWYAPKTSAVTEFVYPKSEAVAIAKVNDSKVPAIDPASEGRKADPTLSKEDMELVTLWLLSSSTVGAAPEIKAERYKQASGKVAPRKPVIAQLPHTASNLPWLWLTGVLSLVSAALLRLTRPIVTAACSSPSQPIA